MSRLAVYDRSEPTAMRPSDMHGVRAPLKASVVTTAPLQEA
jgi:hypothetical protein